MCPMCVFNPVGTHVSCILIIILRPPKRWNAIFSNIQEERAAVRVLYHHGARLSCSSLHYCGEDTSLALKVRAAWCYRCFSRHLIATCFPCEDSRGFGHRPLHATRRCWFRGGSAGGLVAFSCLSLEFADTCIPWLLGWSIYTALEAFPRGRHSGPAVF